MAYFLRYDVWQRRRVHWFSYVKPYMMYISGFSEALMTFIMMLAGLGMVLGNLLSGRISGRYTPLRIAVVTDFVIVLAW